MKYLGLLIVVGLVGAACATTKAAVRVEQTALPHVGDVNVGRFMEGVELDGDVFTITPSPTSTRPLLSDDQAEGVFEAVSAQGPNSKNVFGFGLVSISPVLTRSVHVASLYRTPAWVHVTWDGAVSCPSRGPSDTTADVAPGLTPGYTAIVIVGRGAPVLVYTSRGSFCGETTTGPSLEDATPPSGSVTGG
jgi:hypothetical protein